MIEALPPVDEIVEKESPRNRSSCLSRDEISNVSVTINNPYALAELLELESRLVFPQLATLLELPLKPREVADERYAVPDVAVTEALDLDVVLERLEQGDGAAGGGEDAREADCKGGGEVCARGENDKVLCHIEGVGCQLYAVMTQSDSIFHRWTHLLAKGSADTLKESNQAVVRLDKDAEFVEVVVRLLRHLVDIDEERGLGGRGGRENKPGEEDGVVGYVRATEVEKP